jgi:hypothetical protein
MFFAVSALVLVGLLSAPMGGSEIDASELTAKAEVPAVLKTSIAKSKNAVKIADRKASRKIVLKKS